MVFNSTPPSIFQLLVYRYEQKWWLPNAFIGQLNLQYTYIVRKYKNVFVLALETGRKARIRYDIHENIE
jgi:hypothetical protein